MVRLKVRTKLILLVAVCVLPALLDAVGRAQLVYGKLIDLVSVQMDLAERTFAGDLHEDVEGIRRTLQVAGADPRLQRDLMLGDDGDARRLLASLGRDMEGAAFMLVDNAGHLVGSSQGLGAELGSGANHRELEPVLGGAEATLLPFTIEGQRRYAVVVAEPVEGLDGLTRLGTLLMVRPVGAGYLDHLKERAGGDWSLQVNGEVMATSARHPRPRIQRVLESGVSVGRDRGRYYTVKAFQPPLFQREGQAVEVTISQDITALRASANRELLVSVGILLAATGVALLLSRATGNRMVQSIERIGAAAASLKTGEYRPAEVVRTGDELEALAGAFNQALHGLKERDQLKDAFGKYANRHVVELVTQGKKIELGGETIPVTVFFADIRGFTTISEKMEPRRLLDFLNLYFREMVGCVIAEGGAVDKYIGDAIMAVFGAPVPEPDDALRAVRAALQMRARLASLNESFAERGLPQIRFGLGIHSGTVVAGHMGHSERLEYTVIGDPVNVASRLESMTKELQVDILLSEDTFLKVRDRVEAEPLQRMAVRGRAQEILVYRVVRLLEPETTAAA
ncbi:MAG TPA: adenylate/guanylate cyclase domain-containing protein [Myxococcaceae bacterium]|jgi:adenylate cyclase